MFDKIEKEKSFHNIRFDKETRNNLFKYYSISSILDSYFGNKLRNECRNRKVLEFGCGLGSQCFDLSNIASEIHAIDISEVAVKKAIEETAKRSINNITFYVMNAEKLDFPDDFFDVVYGSAILHHLDLNLAYSELSRVLKPDGKIFFLEPLGYNPLVFLYRKITKKLRTDDEHPLLYKDLKLIDDYFGNKKIKYFYLTSLMAVPFRNSRMFSKILNALNSFDQLLFNSGFLKYLAWIIVLELWNPKK